MEVYFLFASTEWPFPSSRNEMVQSTPTGMKWVIPFRPEWTGLFRPEWNGSFHSGRNEISHSIPFQPEWTGPFRPEWNGPFHSGWNGMDHFILAGMEWPISFRPEWTAPFQPEWNEPFHSDRNEMSIPWTQIRNMPPGATWLLLAYFPFKSDLHHTIPGNTIPQVVQSSESEKSFQHCKLKCHFYISWESK